MSEIRASLDVFDYSGNKLCGLYDSQNDLIGQAYDITFSQNMKDGIHELQFKIPYMLNMPAKNTKAWRDIVRKTWGEVRQVDWGDIKDDISKDLNFRWRYLKSEYIIRLYYNGETQWYIAKKPQKSKSNKEIFGTVACKGIEVTLKTKNIYMEFDDTNGIGTADELLDKILAGTDWSRGETDPIYEKDGVTEKIRSITSGDKQGALGLIVKLCNLFKCYPVFDSDNKHVILRNFNNRTQVLEGVIGENLEALTVSYDSDDIITRLYVEGEYGDNGYVGIDSVNPTGLNYIMNFDYYREIGVMSQAQEYALEQYTVDIRDVKDRITANQAAENAVADDLNDLIGQCKMVLYYTTGGFTTPYYVYGEVADEKIPLVVGDDVVVLNTNGTFRYDTIETTAQALIESGDYGIAKFVTGAAGQIGAKEVAIEAKEKEIAELDRKIAATVKADKIAEYTAEKARLQVEISEIYSGDASTTGLYAMMDSVMKKNTGLIPQIKTLEANYETLSDQQDVIEADFIIAMGDLLKDGYWPCNDYIPGQEQALYDDAVERLNIMSKPQVSYQFNYIRVMQEFDLPIEDIQLNCIFRINDDDLEVYDNTFVTDITIGVDNLENGTIGVSNNDITISSNDLGSLLSRMSQLADLIDQRNAMYERAKAISKNGTFFSDRLEGQINVLTNKIMSTVSNWYTDDRGNIMFLAEDGGSAMMLSGAGWMIASSKDDNGQWIWRTAATGEGLTADVITAGFISAERIESASISVNKLEPNVGNSLVISGNPTITNLNDQIATEFDPTVAYDEGDIVMYEGNTYVFIQNHPAGAWNPDHVLQTNISTQIELLPDKIISMVARKGYSKTYVSDTDPALDPANEVRPGDYWVKPNSSFGTWQNVRQKKWSAVKTHTWYDVLNTVADSYVREGEGADAKWIPVYDTAVMTEAYTRIEQNADAIIQEAYRASAAEGVLNTRITQTADAIVLEASRASVAEGQLSSRITQTADAITSEVTRASNAEGNLSSRITQTAEDITSEVTRATEAEGNLSSRISQTAEAISAEVTRAQNAESGLIAKTDDYQTVNDLTQYAHEQAEAAATSAKNASIARTNVYQTADAIVSSAIAIVNGTTTDLPTFSADIAYKKGDSVKYNGQGYIFVRDHQGAWNANDVKTITPYIAQTNTYQTADSIEQEAVRVAGENAAATYLAKTGTYATVQSIIDDAHTYAEGQAATAKSASIAKTDVYQTAEAIVSSAVALVDGDISSLPAFSTTTQYYAGDAVKYNSKGYIFTTNHKGAWNASHVKEIVPYIAQTNTYQTADSIEQEAVRVAGVNAAAAYLAKTGTYATVQSIIDDAHTYAEGQASDAKNASIAKTDRYQSAEAIVDTAVALVDGDISSLPAFSTTKQYYAGDAVKYNNKGYIFTTSHKGAWDASHVKEIVPYIAQTSSYQTAGAIVTEAERLAGVAETNAKNASIAKTSDYQTVASILTEAQNKADAAASSAKAASIAKTSVYQSADSIVSSAIALVSGSPSDLPTFSSTTQYYKGDAVKRTSGGTTKAYVFTTDHKGAWSASDVKEITPYIAQTTSYQTADSLVTEAVRQAGVNASSAYIAQTSTYTTIQSILNKAYSDAEDLAETAANGCIAKTTTYQTADAIVNTAVAGVDNIPIFSTSTAYAKGDLVVYNGKIYKFKSAHSAGAWNSSQVDLVGVGSQYIARTSTYQTADAIVTAAEGYTDGKLTSYSTTTQTNNLISAYVGENAYGKVSGITITANGIDISGSQYVKIASGGYFQVTTGDFKIDTNVAANGYVILAGSSTASNANFKVKKNGEVTLTKLLALDSEGQESEVNLRTAGLWKLSYQTVRAWGENSITLSNGQTVNFNTAASVTVDDATARTPSSAAALALVIDISLTNDKTVAKSVDVSAYRTMVLAAGRTAGWNDTSVSASAARNGSTLTYNIVGTATLDGTNKTGTAILDVTNDAAGLITVEGAGTWVSGEQEISAKLGTTVAATGSVSMPVSAEWEGNWVGTTPPIISVTVTVGGKRYSHTFAKTS